ncbi:hypothetical protein B0H13DRAFT_1923705 [Mycena leptocephala]|nr:hypothetical protein B0H13DRAFT_1923705 [Mycena leptocephala]
MSVSLTFADSPINMRSTTASVTLPSGTGGKPPHLPAKSNEILNDSSTSGSRNILLSTLSSSSRSTPFVYHEASFFLVRLLQSFSEIALAPSAQHVRYTACDPSDDPIEWKRTERLAIKTHLTMCRLWVSMVEPADAAERPDPEVFHAPTPSDIPSSALSNVSPLYNDDPHSRCSTLDAPHSR